jgi:hypothetical protein
MQSQSALAITKNVPPPLELLQVATGYWISRAIYVAARLEIADRLKTGPMTCVELAIVIAAHADSPRHSPHLPSSRPYTVRAGRPSGGGQFVAWRSLSRAIASLLTPAQDFLSVILNTPAYL